MQLVYILAAYAPAHRHDPYASMYSYGYVTVQYTHAACHNAAYHMQSKFFISISFADGGAMACYPIL